MSYGLDSNTNRGVATDIRVSLVDMPSAFEEHIFIMFKNKHFSNQLLFGNIYPSPNSAEENDNKLYELLNYLQNKFEVPILITGDFNSHIEWNQDYGH